MQKLFVGSSIAWAFFLLHCGASQPGTSHDQDPSQAEMEDASAERDAAHSMLDGTVGRLLDASSPTLQPDAGASVDSVGLFGPIVPQNPGGASFGFATQHGDTGASDTSPLPGPGAAQVVVQHLPTLAACPSILISADGLVSAVCTQISNQTPAVYLLDGTTGSVLATRELSKGNLFGGVYPYLDQRDRLVVVDGAQNLLHITHSQDAQGSWSLDVEASLSLMSAEGDGCSNCGVVGLAPDYDGRIWYATAGGQIGIVDPSSGSVMTTALPDGEQIANGIATAPEGTAVLSDHALYLFGRTSTGTPTLRSRFAYDRGPARKPGQLSYGSGSTPTFFGPRTGSEYLTITDNASPVMNLLVFHADDLTKLVCTLALPAPAGDGSENSPIGSGRSVFVASTFGYPYAALPSGSMASIPASSPILGGMVRVDVALDEQSCSVVWTNAVRSSAVPKLSLADGLIYTIERKLSQSSGNWSPLDGFAYTVIDPLSGKVTYQQDLPGTADTMELAGTLSINRVLYQGTIAGIMRIAPAAP